MCITCDLLHHMKVYYILFYITFKLIGLVVLRSVTWQSNLNFQPDISSSTDTLAITSVSCHSKIVPFYPPPTILPLFRPVTYFDQNLIISHLGHLHVMRNVISGRPLLLQWKSTNRTKIYSESKNKSLY